MKSKMYMVRDTVAGCLVGAVMLERNDSAAVRGFYEACRNPKSLLSQYPKDYELVCLGSHDDEKGITDHAMELIASGYDFLKEEERANAERA